ncbi:MAG: TonB-dependent receptor [Calditrichaeota bacterium]|nr:MAG: TonB-dependent receptor [Calditrichota bacterium]MBL1206808.1 TonB-dependent receptor [Calditrichota bacterium]NOG46636.1 TonB-dependent receptor [Calditrichota bacterium]
MGRLSTYRIIFSFFISLFLLGTAFGQTGKIAGSVYDADNGDPLVGVNVEVLDQFTGAATDGNGEYVITIAEGSYTLRITIIGYESVDKDVKVISGETTRIDFETNQTIAELADVVVVIGSRAQRPRTSTESVVPVDVIDIQQLVSQAPQVTVNEILNYAAPSFSSNTQTISDGTDHIDPASLRGLGPDQVLVLINGKRRHTTSLVNVNGTFGRGNVGTDLNSIPSAAIKRVEVLRDGAAAQYGSDAIAGVINIVLRDATDKLNVTTNAGSYYSSESEGDNDGSYENVSMNYGLPLGTEGGFINFTGSYEDRDPTNRMKEWEGQIFAGYNSTDPNYSGDPDADITDAELARRGQTRSDYNMRVGQAAYKSGSVFLNMAIPTSKTSEVYAFGGLSYRNGNSAGFYRLPYQERTVTSVYHNGFLPEINSIIHDRSFAIGIRGKAKGWDLDLSNTWGTNTFQFQIGNTLNASLEDATKTSYNSGGHGFTQNTANFDASRHLDDIMEGLNMAFGFEYRYENYEIIAGEEGSYAKYDKLGNIVTPNTPDSLIVRGPNGSARPGGAQVFPGFRPSNELSEYRTSAAFYADVEVDFTESLFGTAAYRFEDYSDFGSTNNFKIAGRVQATDDFAVRGAFSTGFRAPSLHQIYFNSTSTLFVDGIPNEVGSFSNDSRVAQILGIPKLKEETSQNISLGVTANLPDLNTTVTVDAYQIDITDRVVKTGTFSAGDGEDELAALLASVNATGAAFFANAIDTKTQGVDLVVTHRYDISEDAFLSSNISATYSETTQEGDIHSSPLLKDKESTYFDETSRIYLESATPRTKINITETYTRTNWNAMLRGVYFGEVNEATNNVDNQQLYAGKWVFDTSVGYKILNHTWLTVGINNLLDTYPDEAIKANQSSGRFLYSRRSKQFGVNGRYLFSRLSFNL